MTITGMIIFFIVLLVVSVFILLFPKIKALFTKGKASSKQNSKNKNSKSKKNTKVKPSNAASQIRPTLKPANSEKEKEDLKLLEAQKENKKLDYEPVPALDFKYSGTRREPNFGINSQNKDPLQSTVRPLNSTIPVRTPNEIRKDFDDIKNFLDMPTNSNTQNLNNARPGFNNTNLNNSGRLNYHNGPSFNNNFPPINIPNNNSRLGQPSIRRPNLNNRIDPSIFNDEESDFVDYRNLRNNNFSTLNAQNASRFGTPSPISRFELPNGQMRTNNKYSRPVMYNDVDLNNFRANNINLGLLNKDINKENIVRYDDVDIDLNKLSPKLKRLIITNILKRKDFD